MQENGLRELSLSIWKRAVYVYVFLGVLDWDYDFLSAPPKKRFSYRRDWLEYEMVKTSFTEEAIYQDVVNKLADEMVGYFRTWYDRDLFGAKQEIVDVDSIDKLKWFIEDRYMGKVIMVLNKDVFKSLFSPYNYIKRFFSFGKILITYADVDKTYLINAAKVYHVTDVEGDVPFYLTVYDDFSAQEGSYIISAEATLCASLVSAPVIQLPNFIWDDKTVNDMRSNQYV